MHWASQGSSDAAAVRTFRLLAEAGADPRALNTNGHSCLHKAASKGSTTLCRLLLEEFKLGTEHVRPDLGEGNRPSDLARLEVRNFTRVPALLLFFNPPRHEESPYQLCTPYVLCVRDMQTWLSG